MRLAIIARSHHVPGDPAMDSSITSQGLWVTRICSSFYVQLPMNSAVGLS